MIKTWKRILALSLSVLLVLGAFSACGNKVEKENAEASVQVTEPKVTEPPEEAKTLKVLTLGHSLATDCGYMLAMIAAAEGYESMKVGTLYYSGCPLYKHVEYLRANAPEYVLYISSTETANQTPTGIENVTMKDAIKFEYWDIIIMQGGVFEIAEDGKYKDGNIQEIQAYVNEHKLNPLAKFAWHMAWAPPVNNDLRDKYPYPESNTYYSSYVPYGDNRTTLYNSIAKCVGDNILTDDTFEFMIPSGTAFENALSSYLEETDLHRDYVHASDFSRVMVSYLWYCKLAGIDKLEEIKLEKIPKNFFKSTQAFEDYVLTDMDKAIIIESVNNALANPLQMTPSQYTTAP